MKNKLHNTIERKIIKTYNLKDYEILTDNGFVDIIALHETIPYQIYILKTKTNKVLKCADTHIVFNENFEEIFVKDLKNGDTIITLDGVDIVSEVINIGKYETMFDFELVENSNHRYFTNGILSHNTHLAKKLAEEIYGDEKALIRIDMSEYSEKNSVTKLTGSAPGYVGFEQGGQLTEAVKNKQYCVLLLDEIEKADESVYNVFLQLFDEGRLTDSNGATVNFKNTIILMTSNIGAKKASELGNGIGFSNDVNSNKKHIIDKELKRKFTPEFLNRIDKIVQFNALTDDNLRNIVKLECNKFAKRMNELNYYANFDESVYDFIFSLAVKEKEYGARPIIRIIQDNIEDKVTELLLEREYEKGYTFEIKCINSEINIK